MSVILLLKVIIGTHKDGPYVTVAELAPSVTEDL
jgi:hypothetical protein